MKDSGTTSRPALLLHSCCGPCSSYVLEYLKYYFNIFLLYYNPNIYPKKEYEQRKNEQLQLISRPGFENVSFIDADYNHEKFLIAVDGYENFKEGGQRCDICFKLRLEEAARVAKKLDMNHFATTLTVSPHKSAESINRIGNKLGIEYSLNYLLSDFKKNDGYKKSILLSKKYRLYRQNYCGCEFSLHPKSLQKN